MKRNDVATRCEEELIRAGAKPHCIQVELVPSRVDVSVVAGGSRITRSFRSGISEHELDCALQELRSLVSEREGTVDLEEALA